MVESGKPRCEEARIVAADDVSAAKPCGDSTSVIFVPTVRMIRQPPIAVPRPIASPQLRITQNCGAVFGVLHVRGRPGSA